MTIEETKKNISVQTGLPVELLTGETTEEVQARALALMAYKASHNAPDPAPGLSTAQQFARWINGQSSEEPQKQGDSSDPGELQNDNKQSTAEQFAEWLGQTGF